ncbi:MAG: HD domain-containing protein [Bacteroidales bacterium]|nr:HD domain-containing protein [Bacteroidales bacterium]
MSLIEKAAVFATDLLQKEPTSGYPYHNLNHTLSVVKHVQEIGEHAYVDDKDLTILTLSAWFHDIGYTRDYNHHEEKGVEIAREFLGSINHKILDHVESCILATRMPQNPGSFIEKILCDADMYHLSEDTLIENSDKLRQEINMVTGKQLSLQDYLHKTLNLLYSHEYFTEYARKHLNSRKLKNIEKIKRYLPRNT